jgi:threonine dehydrogenase-like Zn-dependent dehydrogenase
MQAVVFLGSGRWEVKEVEEPRLERSDDVLLAVERAGICGTDLHILSDPPGHPATPGCILGHEYVARVVEAGSNVRTLRKDDRVVVDPNIPCRECEFCRAGRTNLCPRMTTLGIFRNGGLARYSVAPASALHKVAADVSPERAVLAEPLSCIFAAYQKAPVRGDDSVVVLGAGPIGLAFILLYRKMGAGTLVAVEPRELRRRVALELGADQVIDSPVHGLPSRISDVLPRGADIVIDAAGTLLGPALTIVRPGGTVVLFGMVERTSAAISQYDLTRRELTLVGSFIQTDTFPKVTEVLRQPDFPIERIISHSLPLARIGEALDSMKKGLALKVILDPTNVV